MAGSSSLGRPTRKGALAMIFGVHVVVYSKDASADRAFFRDVLGYASVDAGHDWLIFALPPAELAVHPRGGWRARAVPHVRRPPWRDGHPGGEGHPMLCHRRGPMGDGDEDPTSRWGDSRPVPAHAPDGARADLMISRGNVPGTGRCVEGRSARWAGGAPSCQNSLDMGSHPIVCFWHAGDRT